jgi:hypothetical protein
MPAKQGVRRSSRRRQIVGRQIKTIIGLGLSVTSARGDRGGRNKRAADAQLIRAL